MTQVLTSLLLAFASGWVGHVAWLRFSRKRANKQVMRLGDEVMAEMRTIKAAEEGNRPGAAGPWVGEVGQ